MANEEQLKIVKQGAKIWNEWRRMNRKIHVDLIQADLSGSILSDANLEEVDLRASNLTGANLCGSNLLNANLSGARLTDANLRAANLFRTNLGGADLRGVDLYGANLISTAFIHSYLTNASIVDAVLWQTTFAHTSLESVKGLDRCRHLGPSYVDYSTIVDAVLWQTTFAHTSLESVKGLDRCRHLGPSYVDYSTLSMSGPLPGVFLRGCGLPGEFIQLLPSFRSEFDSCFISYSGKDEEFAQRLDERMRSAMMRVWFAPVDLKGGDKLLDQLERAIQSHRRLLLVLSDHSIMSEWVMTEIRRAREAERKEGRRKLYPIRLTDFKTLNEWKCPDSKSGQDLAEEVRQYYIPDFSNWKNHDDFEKAFDRLLRDLKAEAP